MGFWDKGPWGKREIISHSLMSVSTLIFPSQCINCGIEIKNKAKLVCFGCASRIKWTGHLDKEVQHQIIQLVNLPCVLGAHSLFVFAKNSVEQALIHRLKYQHSKQTGFILGKLFAQKIKNKIQEGTIDMLVPVPSHHIKKFDRGYNQAETIAKGLSKELSIPISVNLIYKTKNASSQTQLNKEERGKNVRGSFMPSGEFRNVKSIGIIDDVITSGATIKELCKSISEINRSIRITIFVLGVVRRD